MRRYLPVLPVLFICLALAACTSQQGATRPVGEAEAQQVRAIADPIATDFGQGLMGKVKQTMQTHGIYHTTNFCQAVAQSLTIAAERDLDEGFAIKRTTFQYRNPANAPDDYEARALEYFQQRAQQGSLPADYVQHIGDEYRYYKPLKMQEMCLRCHGDPAQMDPAVLQRLQELYPEDKALGYAEGDFRGVIRISVPASRVE
jgi:hypothetical protein